jgi:hypothetical protein
MDDAILPRHASSTEPDGGIGRRRCLGLLGLALLGGCAAPAARVVRPAPLEAGDLVASRPIGGGSPPASASLVGPDEGALPGIVRRSRWAGGDPRQVLMNRMKPVTHVTVHHDGLSPFSRTDEASVAARIELIRRSHQARGWGDIGYHFVVDRAGRVWQARPLVWQGAHVKNRNEGNIGVLVLGNFEQQQPTDPQLRALAGHLAAMCGVYRISPRAVLTHREWPGAETLCPGRNLQGRMAAVRQGVRTA